MGRADVSVSGARRGGAGRGGVGLLQSALIGAWVTACALPLSLPDTHASHTSCITLHATRAADFNMNRSPTGSIRKGLSALGSVVGGSTGLLPRHHSSGTVPGVAASEDGGATTTSVTAAPLTAVGTPYRVGGAANSMSGGGDVPTPFNVDGSPYHAYVSSFGNLPPLTVDNSQQMNRILLTHAPYMSKLESLASSATRCVGGGLNIFPVCYPWCIPPSRSSCCYPRTCALPLAPPPCRTAEKINAGLIVVMVQTGRTVSLVSKYRPPMPIMAVVVPQLKSTRLGWHLEGALTDGQGGRRGSWRQLRDLCN